MSTSTMAGPMTPRARRALRAAGIDAVTLRGSGPNGRIVAADVAAAVKTPARTHGRTRPLSAMRRTIARRLLQSKQTIPHFYIRQTIDAGALAEFYITCKALFPCSLNDIIVQASAMAASEFADFRCRLEDDVLVELPDANIGLAVGLDEGVVVAPIAKADQLGLRALALETRRVVALARERRPQTACPTVFSVSNLGMFGADEFSAIINPPEAAILAVGALRDAAVVQSGKLAVGKALTLTLSCDHRIIDGKGAAQFLARLQAILLRPAEFIRH
ncbi:MAG: pdhC [Verrucomicrobia bacterium]|nr:pdhC [Verrucomicrobiota bacterium]